MEISVDISLYPLTEDYVEPILAFIKGLEKNPKITVIKNQLSTQIYGDYDDVMALISTEMKAVFEAMPHSAMVMKFIGNNRADVEVDW
ncbi:MAG: hypothetical protein CR955_00195 [Thiotrichales bacterium]|nr:MAG: hypothetical protein CR955_00195 [Thiotrichales bacterium]